MATINLYPLHNLKYLKIKIVTRFSITKQHSFKDKISQTNVSSVQYFDLK